LKRIRQYESQLDLLSRLAPSRQRLMQSVFEHPRHYALLSARELGRQLKKDSATGPDRPAMGLIRMVRRYDRGIPMKRLRVRAGSVLIVFLVVVFEAIGAAGQSGSRLSTTVHVSEAGKEQGTLLAKSQAALPMCPSAGLPAVQPRIGHHKVILSWTASPKSPDPEKNAVGYCLYRSKKHKAAKQNPLCFECERINSVPVPKPACTDDIVEDDAHYYYVVAAISIKGRISSASNEAEAKISGKKGSSSDLHSPSSPSCRASDPRQASIVAH
jgi:hypothetical protein